MKREDTKLTNLMQPPLNTTMMGVLRGVCNYYGLGLSEPMIYGLSGHAFLINVHVELCPSGPYCWKLENAKPLIHNMGMNMANLGFFDTEAEENTRADIEGKLRQALDSGIPCSLLSMEHQLITGYDDAGFLLSQPWGSEVEFTPDRLSFGSWQEFGDEVHVSFYAIEKGEPSNRKAAVLASLEYALDIHRHPAKHSMEAYGVGPEAYANWIAAVPAHGSGHGNCWNATVWSECRRMAAAYFLEIGDGSNDVAELCLQLNSQYQRIAENLRVVSNKAMDAGEKAALLEETKELEAAAITRIETLAAKVVKNGVIIE